MFKKINELNLNRFFKIQGKERQLIFTVTVLLVLSVNILLSGFSLRYDASAGKAYTLSDSSKKVLHSLDDLVNINFFASSDLPARLIPLKTDVTDTLTEFKKEGKGKLQLNIIDPKKDENSLKKVREAGIPELQFSQLEQDKYAVSTSYFGISLNYGGKQEVIPQVTDLENLEYNLTSAIYKLTNKELVRVGIVGQTNSANPNEDPVLNFRKILGQQFNVESLDLSPEAKPKKIDPAYKLLFVFDSASREYSRDEINLLKNYLNNRGKIVFFTDGVWVSEQLTTAKANHNLFLLFKDYGITLENDLILSTSAELVNFGGNDLSLLIPYPFWFKTNNFNPKITYFSNVSQLTFPWGSSLKLEKKNNFDSQELVKTSNRSWLQKDNFVLNPQEIQAPSENDYKEFVVAAESAKKNGGRIVVIPSSRFVLERYLSANTGNLEFVLNISGNFASGGALSGIRSRAVSFYPLPDLGAPQKDMFKYINILFLPVLFSLWGIVRLLKRR